LAARQGYLKSGEREPAEQNGAGPDEIATFTGNPLEVADTDVLERPVPVFFFPDMPMPRLKRVLKDNLGLELEHSAEIANMVLPAGNLSGKSLAEILMTMLEPMSQGFYRQGGVIHVIPMDLKNAEKSGSGDVARKSGKMRAKFRAKAGAPLELWIDRELLLFLRITAQPLFGEGVAEGEVGLSVEAVRNQRTWFFQDIEAQLGQTVNLEMTGRHYVSCQITPVGMEDKSWIVLEVELRYEASASVE
jgi:hypothetical protein